MLSTSPPYPTVFNMDITGVTTSTDMNITDHNLTAYQAATVDDDEDIIYYPMFKQPTHMIVLFTVAYSVVFLLGVLGNALVVCVVYRNPRMHNVTNYFIVNLAVADVLVCVFCLPITLLSNLYTGWRFGAILCKITPFLQGVAVSASVNTMAAIALDRYLAICYLLSFRLTRNNARIIIIGIWIFAIGIMAPWVVYYEQKVYWSTPLQTIYICDQFWPNQSLMKGYFLAAIFLTCYTIPLIWISACYSLIGYKVWNRKAPGVPCNNQIIYKSKVKALKMLIVVVVLFSLSWLPLYAVYMRIYFGVDLVETTTEFAMLSQVVIPISQWLGASNSCVNPVIYCFFSNKFRHGFKRMMQCCRKNGLRNQSSVYRNNSVLYFSVNNNCSNNTVVYNSASRSESPVAKIRITPPKSVHNNRIQKDKLTIV